jgi:FkbM family methyltransferase
MSERLTLTEKLTKLIKKSPAVRAFLIKYFGTQILQFFGRKTNTRIRSSLDYYDLSQKNHTVRISKNHFLYVFDIINSFEYYFSAVEPIDSFGKKLVDYSTPRYHDVIGYDRHPVFFPSLSEPIVTTNQYIDFSNLKAGSTAIDIGAYSGLTSLVFKDIVGPAGTVVAVDADKLNLIALEKNVSAYEAVTSNKIEILYGAVWMHDNGLEFSTEGNMGSSAADIVGSGRGTVTKVPSFKLSQVANMFNLEKIDFIKCDIEGAESVIFEDREFFEKFHPRIIVETHLINGEETTNKCVSDLESYGYTCKRVTQTGSTLPLIECYPPLS